MATLAQCKKALELYEEELSGYENVVGLGITRLEEKGSDSCAVTVYVREPTPKRQKGIPNSLTISSRKGDIQVPVRVVHQGPVSLERETFQNE